MSVVGLLFLLFEETIVSQSGSAKEEFTSACKTGLPRIILGAQVNVHQTDVRVISADAPSIDRTNSAGNVCHKIKCCVFAGQGRFALWQSARWVVRFWCSIPSPP